MKGKIVRKVSNLLLVATAVTALWSASAQAADLTFQYYAYGGAYNSLGSPNTFSPGSGGTFGSYFNYTANNNRIVIDFTSPVTWSSSTTSLNSGGLYIDNGALFTNPNISISSVLIDALSTGLGGFNGSNITFNANNVALAWQNLSFGPDSRLVLDINGRGGGVPEPATWALMILGFGVVGSALRRRRGELAIA